MLAPKNGHAKRRTEGAINIEQNTEKKRRINRVRIQFQPGKGLIINNSINAKPNDVVSCTHIPRY